MILTLAELRDTCVRLIDAGINPNTPIYDGDNEGYAVEMLAYNSKKDQVELGFDEHEKVSE